MQGWLREACAEDDTLLEAPSSAAGDAQDRCAASINRSKRPRPNCAPASTNSKARTASSTTCSAVQPGGYSCSTSYPAVPTGLTRGPSSNWLTPEQVAALRQALPQAVIGPVAETYG